MDNGSTENVTEALPDDPRIRVVDEQVPGSSAARNKGLTVATGEVVAFTDADCLPVPEWPEQAVGALTTAPTADLVGGPVRLLFEGDRPSSAAELYESRHGFTQGLAHGQDSR